MPRVHYAGPDVTSEVEFSKLPVGSSRFQVRAARGFLTHTAWTPLIVLELLWLVFADGLC